MHGALGAGDAAVTTALTRTVIPSEVEGPAAHAACGVQILRLASLAQDDNGPASLAQDDNGPASLAQDDNNGVARS